jgi:hypothetical protein
MHWSEAITSSVARCKSTSFRFSQSSSSSSIHARFLGSPIDFVVFAGLDEGEECRDVVLVEVKTGKSALSKRERQVRDAVEAGRVSYRLIRIAPRSDDSVATAVDAPAVGS